MDEHIARTARRPSADIADGLRRVQDGRPARTAARVASALGVEATTLDAP